MLEILNFFSNNISNLLYQNIGDSIQTLEEIRIRVDKPIILKFLDKENIISYKTSSEEILNILQKICDNSIYSYQNQICSRIHNNKRWT